MCLPFFFLRACADQLKGEEKSDHKKLWFKLLAIRLIVRADCLGDVRGVECVCTFAYTSHKLLCVRARALCVCVRARAPLCVCCRVKCVRWLVCLPIRVCGCIRVCVSLHADVRQQVREGKTEIYIFKNKLYFTKQ